MQPFQNSTAAGGSTEYEIWFAYIVRLKKEKHNNVERVEMQNRLWTWLFCTFNMSFKREGDDQSQLNVLKVTGITSYFSIAYFICEIRLWASTRHKANLAMQSHIGDVESSQWVKSSFLPFYPLSIPEAACCWPPCKFYSRRRSCFNEKWKVMFKLYNLSNDHWILTAPLQPSVTGRLSF